MVTVKLMENTVNNHVGMVKVAKVTTQYKTEGIMVITKTSRRMRGDEEEDEESTVSAAPKAISEA